MSARSATTPAELATAFWERLSALARAQDLTLPDLSAGETKAQYTTTLVALLHTILAPFGDLDRERIFVRGCDVPIGDRVLTNFALLLHEFATNAAKYGSLSVADGRLDIDLAKEGGDLVLNWTESGGPQLAMPDMTDGFGSRLERSTIEGQL
jgi:two-component sensor histidine kinase